MLISGQWIKNIILRGAISYEKAPTPPPLKMAPELEYEKKREKKWKGEKETALSEPREKVGNTYAHP